LRRFLLKLIRRRRLQRDLDAELSFHEEMARLHRNPVRLGNRTLVQEQVRDLWRFPIVESILMDATHAARSLRKSPVLTAVIFVTLALGIGANTALFSVVQAMFLRPLPDVKDPSSVIAAYTSSSSNSSYSTFSFPDYQDLRDNLIDVSSMAAYWTSQFEFIRDAAFHNVSVTLSTGNYFQILGIRPRVGRFLTVQDDRGPSSELPAVISAQLWSQLFNSDPHTLGQTFLMNNHLFTVVGVTPERFRGLTLRVPTDIWVPFSALQYLAPARVRELEERGNRWLNVIGRIEAPVPISRVQNNAKIIAERLAREYPESNGPRLQSGARTMTVVPINDSMVGFVLRARTVRYAAVIAGIVALVLLITCANVASLLVARSWERQRDTAVRMALGAGKWRIMSRSLLESVFLSVGGGVLGLTVAVWMAQAAATNTISGYWALPWLPAGPSRRTTGPGPHQ
jgi:putative ABC transport system permease protein